MTTLPKHIYDEFAAVVGESNLTDDAAFLGSHDWYGLGAMPNPKTLQGKPPSLVVMPGSTEEVAGVVKVCNRHGLKFKPHSSGYGNFAGVSTAGAVSIDLRRMNKLEIDAKNRMAIIEPYATAGELFSEAMKHNLMCHIIGAGPIHSPLASATAFFGVGIPGNHTSNNSRNLLSLEWVTPEGEIVRIGSSGSDAGWFTGEGPGPGFRGMIRGLVGSSGGLGVFTRIGYKLYPWAGPEKLEWTGEHPVRGIALPETMTCHHVTWPTYEAMTEGTYELMKARIPTFITRTPPVGLGMMITSTNREYYDLHQAGNLPPIARKETATGWSLMLMAWSKAELDWKLGVMRSILEKTGGSECVLDPMHRDVLAANMVTSLYVARFLRMGTVTPVSMAVLDSVGLLPKLMQRTQELIGKEGEPGGVMLQADTEQNWMWLSEGRHLWSENNPVGNRFNPKSAGGILLFMINSFMKNERSPVGMAGFVQGPAVELFGPALGNVQKWMRRVKLMFDPRDLSDTVHFITPKEPGVTKVWPVAKHILFQPWFKRVGRWLMTKQN